MTRMRFPERALLLAVHAGIALILLTPLVWAPFTYFPFAVGKGVYARSVIALVVVLWALLALARPRWRPLPGVILAALGAGLAVAALSAWLGVGPQRSLWSTYTRMEGIVDGAHWFAFFVVLAAVVRTTAHWARLLNVNLAVGLCVAAVAVVRFYAPDLSFPGLPPEGRYPRVSATMGNPTFLGAYLQAIVLLAIGFLVRSSFAAPVRGTAVAAAARMMAPGRIGSGHGDAAGRARGRSRRSRPAAGSRPRASTSRIDNEWAARLFWAVTAVCAVFALALTGSMGALAGLGAGAGLAAVLHAWLAPSLRVRRIAFRAVGALAAAALALVLVLAVRAADPPGEIDQPVFDSVLIERVTSTRRIGATLGTRLRNWEAGLRAFAERPLLGWGSGNYFVASARYLSRPPGRTRIRDHAQNMLIEEAATKGLAGLAAYLALWGFTFHVILRAARRAGPRDRALIIFAGAALAGWFVQSQTLFYSASSWLQHMLLLGFAAHLEVAMRGEERATGARFRAVLAPLRHPSARAAIGVGVLLAAGASLTTNRAVHGGAAAIYRAEHEGPFMAELERSIRAFEPLATGPRVILFNNVAANWPVLSAHHRAEASRLLEWTKVEARAALSAEPESWVIHHALARLYRAVAMTRPAYADLAQRHFDRSLALAPNLDPLEAPSLRGRER